MGRLRRLFALIGWQMEILPSNAFGNVVVEHNHVHDIGKGVMSDMGAVSTRRGSAPGHASGTMWCIISGPRCSAAGVSTMIPAPISSGEEPRLPLRPATRTLHPQHHAGEQYPRSWRGCADT